MCTYWGHVCIYVQNMKFLWSSLWPNKDTNDDYDTQLPIYAKWAKIAQISNTRSNRSCPGSKISIFHYLTLTLTRWPWYSNLAWTCSRCTTILKWCLHVKYLKNYSPNRQTHTQTHWQAHTDNMKTLPLPHTHMLFSMQGILTQNYLPTPETTLCIVMNAVQQAPALNSSIKELLSKFLLTI